MHYFWIKFYTTAKWQLVKFWTDPQNNTKYLKGLDWMTEHELENFANISYEIGPEVFPPDA